MQGKLRSRGVNRAFQSFRGATPAAFGQALEGLAQRLVVILAPQIGKALRVGDPEHAGGLPTATCFIFDRACPDRRGGW